MDVRFKAKIINALRRLTYTWAPRNYVKSTCKIDKALHSCMLCDIYCYEGKSDKSFAAYQLQYGVEKVIFERGHMDHINPVIDPVKGWEGWDTLIEHRMYPETSGWQHLCSTCHKAKTKLENVNRTKPTRKKKSMVKTLVLLIGLLSCCKGVSPDIKHPVIILTGDNSVLLRDDVNDDSAGYVQTKLEELSKRNPKLDLYLVIDTRGGYRDAMDKIINTCNTIPNKVHTITLVSISAGYFIVQLCQGSRYIVQSGYMLTHAWSGFPPNKRGTNYNFIEFFKKQEHGDREFYQKIADRIGIPLYAYLRMIRTDYEMDMYKAIKDNHVDKLISIKCSDSLPEYEHYKMTLDYATYDVERSGCPLLNYIKSINLVDGIAGSNDSQEIGNRLMMR